MLQQVPADLYLFQVLPQKQPVFAFLPLRSYGFRFVIQGVIAFYSFDNYLI